MDSHQCVEKYNPKNGFERAGRIAAVLSGLAIAAYGLHEKDLLVGAIGLGIAVPAGINTAVTEL